MLGSLNPLPNIARRDLERRRHGRLRSQGVGSSLGPVLDVSASGVRVELAGWTLLTLGSETTIQIEGVEVRVRVRRIVKVARAKCEIGLEFLEITEDKRRTLLGIVQGHSAGASGFWSRGV